MTPTPPNSVNWLKKNIMSFKGPSRYHVTAVLREIDKLYKRLEMTTAYMRKDGKTVRISVEPYSIPDGISCRDETIKMQDRRIVGLKSVIAAQERKIKRMGKKK